MNSDTIEQNLPLHDKRQMLILKFFHTSYRAMQIQGEHRPLEVFSQKASLNLASIQQQP